MRGQKARLELFDPHRCYFCGLTAEPGRAGPRNLIELHHITPKVMGGTNDARNMVPCCSNHHSLIHLDKLKLDRWYWTTQGVLLRWWDEDGQEQLGPRRL